MILGSNGFDVDARKTHYYQKRMYTTSRTIRAKASAGQTVSHDRGRDQFKLRNFERLEPTATVADRHAVPIHHEVGRASAMSPVVRFASVTRRVTVARRSTVSGFYACSQASEHRLRMLERQGTATSSYRCNDGSRAMVTFAQHRYFDTHHVKNVQTNDLC